MRWALPFLPRFRFLRWLPMAERLAWPGLGLLHDDWALLPVLPESLPDLPILLPDGLPVLPRSREWGWYCGGYYG